VNLRREPDAPGGHATDVDVVRDVADVPHQLAAEMDGREDNDVVQVALSGT
jgi:hypothetical protein